MSKTAIQQAIERCDYWLKINLDLLVLKSNSSNKRQELISAKILCYRKMKDELTALLPTEREVIEEAYDDGYWDSERMSPMNNDYFTTKFNDNEHPKS
jgi:hypothetical protein